MKRTWIRPKPAKDRDQADAFELAVRIRAAGRCEACDAHRFADLELLLTDAELARYLRCLEACSHRYHEAHHRLTRARGRGWEHLHDPERNGLGCSFEHHRFIHANPVIAQKLDLLRNSWQRG